MKRKPILQEDINPLSWLSEVDSESEKKSAVIQHKNELLTGSAERNSGETCKDRDDKDVSNERLRTVAMPAETKKGEIMTDTESEILEVGDDLSIVQVSRLKEEWVNYIDGGKDITIDASKVEDVDTAGMQLLASFVKSINDSGRNVNWCEASSEMQEAISELALDEALAFAL